MRTAPTCARSLKNLNSVFDSIKSVYSEMPEPGVGVIRLSYFQNLINQETYGYSKH